LGETDSEVTDQSRFAGLKGLSGLGLSPRQIADQMNLPLGEIERVLKRQRTSESGTPAGTRQ
jgi:IS30 family transposase